MNFILDKMKNIYYKPTQQRNARVAQSVEQRTENPRVGGSIPSPSTIQTLVLTRVFVLSEIFFIYKFISLSFRI